MKKIIFVFLTIIFLLLPGVAYASGGGPLILIISISMFIIGQVWILSIETALYKFELEIEWKTAFKDILKINISSSILAILGSLVISFFGLLGSKLPNEIGILATALFTWVYEGMEYGKIAKGSSLLWFIVVYVSITYFEAWYINKLWKNKILDYKFDPLRLSFRINLISCLGMMAGRLIIWNDIFV